MSAVCLHTLRGCGTGFLDAFWLLFCGWAPPDSSDKESKLSVDWPLTNGPILGLRFSGEDSSAKLCIVGGEVSELPPDLGPTEKNKKIKFLNKIVQIYTPPK